MKAKAFIITSFLGFLSIILLYPLLVDKLVIKERNVPYSYRQFFLQSSGGVHGKVIVSAGSNVIHGIDSAQLSEYFNAPVLTYADVGSYPLRSKIFNIEKYVNKGDIVIFPLEWIQYSLKERLSDNYIQALADKFLRLEYYFNNTPYLEKVRFVYTQYPFLSALYGLIVGWDKAKMLQSDSRQLSYFQEKLDSGSMEMYGNSSRNGPEKIEKHCQKLSCNSYLFSHGFTISTAFKKSLKLLKILSDKGVAVYFTWPSVADYSAHKCYQKDINGDIEKFSRDIESLVESAGYKFIGNYNQSHFNESCFLNTYYHLRYDCAVLRTASLINDIKLAGIKPINKYPQVDIGIILQDAINKNKKYIKDKKHEVFPYLSVETIKKNKLSDKIDFVDGWWEQEPWGIWTIGNHSALRFKVSKALLAYQYIKVSIQGIYSNGSRKTKVIINGVYYGLYDLSNKDFFIPTRQLNTDAIEINLTHFRVLSPDELNISKDTRKIKFGLTELGIDTADSNFQ